MFFGSESVFAVRRRDCLVYDLGLLTRPSIAARPFLYKNADRF